MPKNVMCKNCNNYRNDWCEMVLDSPDPDIVRDCRHFWLKTNADRIRAMTDEELAKLVAKYVYCGLCPLKQRCVAGGCNKVVMEWLKEPAEGDA